jgi:hypothetical protein
MEGMQERLGAERLGRAGTGGFWRVMVIGLAFLGWALEDGSNGAGVGGDEVEGAWKRVLALDAGPARGQGPLNEAREIFSRHVALQEQVLRRFLEVCPPEDGRRFEARIRLARALTIRAELDSKLEFQEESGRILDALDAEGTRQQKAEVAFTRISQWMRRNRFPSPEQRQELLAAVREFWKSYSFDRRLPGLLVEVATRFDRDLRVKRELLEGASKLNQDPELRRRIEDDWARLELAGKALPLRFQDLNGRNFRLEDLRGRPVVVLYFSASAPPSLEGWRVLNEVLAKYPKVARVGVSLDEDRVALERVLKRFGDGWIIGWDGRGWLSPLARRWGVNALPTAWLVDGAGTVVSLNVLEDTGQQVSALAGEAAVP